MSIRRWLSWSIETRRGTRPGLGFWCWFRSLRVCPTKTSEVAYKVRIEASR